MGEKIDISNGEKDYYKTLKWYQEKNRTLGYQNGIKNWTRKKYEEERAQMLRIKRINNS